MSEEKTYTRQMTDIDKAGAQGGRIGCLVMAAVVGIGAIIVGIIWWSGADDFGSKVTAAVIGGNGIIITVNWLLRPLLSGGKIPGMPDAGGAVTIKTTDYSITYNTIHMTWSKLTRPVIKDGNLIVYQSAHPKIMALNIMRIDAFENYNDLLDTITEKLGEIEGRVSPG